ncbi:MAG: alpha-ketoacid dehydrogenase subunit beta [Planctomycetes bacterium]|nr:alpha-ketoacid dehydrogenase subunit beta [Planctomycetota bacterium]
MRRLTYAAALREALDQAMARDDGVFVFGEGVDDPGGIFGSTQGLAEKHGAHRCFDTPLAEEALTGIANGAALCGMRPVLVHARVEFALLTLDPILNHAAKWRDMYGEGNAMPIVVRTIIGRGWGQGAQHSQGLAPLFLNVPGVTVVAPVTPADAKGLLVGALQHGDGPVITIEHRQLYGDEGGVSAAFEAIPFGRARVAREGGDVTIVAYSQMVHAAERAATTLAERGIEADVIDLRSLVPLDRETIVASVTRTGRLVIVENGWTLAGVSAEVAAIVAEECPGALRAPIRRIGFPRIATPSSPVLEAAYYPGASTIVEAVETMTNSGSAHAVNADSASRGRALSECW